MPVGIRTYDPHHARGEDHLVNYLGMLGLPMEPSPFFPEPGEGATVLVTAASAKDKDVLVKIKDYAREGGEVVMTSGFIEAMQGRGIEHLTTLQPTGKRIAAGRYGIVTESCTFRDFADGESISFPVFDYSTNGTWQRIVGFNGDNNFPVLMYDHYGKGTIQTLVIPDNFADVDKLPAAVLNEIRKALSGSLTCRLEGVGGAGLFLYDNDALVVESFRPDPEVWRIRVPGGCTLAPLAGSRPPRLSRMDGQTGERFYEVRLSPGACAAFSVVPEEA
jgi:hypothetical protein